MRLLRTMAVGLPWAVALAWLWKALEARAGMRRVPDLNEGPEPVLPAPPGGGPLLSAVIAARNEEQGIGPTVHSLLASRGVALEVIAVEDRSTDRTGAILDHLAAEDSSGRLRVEHINTLPAGWLGKPHALAAGVARSRAPWILCTDGDILFREDALARALAYAEAHQVDHLVLVATPIARSFGESVVLAAIPMLAVWALRPWKVQDPDARESVGMGAFTLVRREALEKAGGWARVRLEVLEDLRLGWELKRRHGLRQHLVLGRDLIRLHWAAGALGLARNLGKNGFAVFRYSVPQVLFGTAAMLVLVFAPLAGWVWPPRSAAARWALLPYVLAIALLRRTHARQGSQPAAALLLLPAGAVLLLWGIVRSMVLTLARGGVEWRETRYPLALLRAHAGPLR